MAKTWPTGRPDRLTAERQERICAAIRAGAPYKDAATSAGIHRATFFRWLARGEAPGAPDSVKAFAAAVRQAEADAIVAAVAHIRAAMPTDWRAAAFFLSRRCPDEWGRTTRHKLEHSAPGGGPLEITGLGDLRKLTDEELDRLQRLLERTHEAS